MSEPGLPSHLLTQLDTSAGPDRLTAVDKLTQLVNGADIATAAAARRALKQLTGDDSRSVSAAAVAALERTAVRLNPDRVDFGQVPPGTQRMVADVVVEGPPLAAGTATVTVAGPGLRAVLIGRRVRVVWQPQSDWLDGSVTVHGLAGWADVRVTGQVAAGPVSRAAVEARMLMTEGAEGVSQQRLTVLPVLPAAVAPPRRRRVGATVLVASLTAVVLLGGAGVAVALTRDDSGGTPTVAAPVPVPVASTAAAPSAAAAPVPGGVVRVPLARAAASLDRPAVVGTIRVGTEPEGVAVSPDGRTVYVADQGAKILSVVDATGKRVTSVGLRNTPRFVAVSRDGRKVFVSMYEDDKSGSGVAVVDAATRKVDRYLRTGVQPYTLSVGPDGRLWVPIHSRGQLEIYAAADQRPAGKVAVPPNPHAVAFAQDLRRAFTPNHESNAVAVVDTATNRMLKSIPVSRSPHSIAVSPDGRTVLVAGYDADQADLIDTRTLRRSGPFKVGSKPQSVAFATDGAHAYVVNEGANSVSVLDGHTGKLTATVAVGRSPRTVAVSPDGDLAYVSNGDDNTISVLRVGR